MGKFGDSLAGAFNAGINPLAGLVATNINNQGANKRNFISNLNQVFSTVSGNIKAGKDREFLQNKLQQDAQNALSLEQFKQDQLNARSAADRAFENDKLRINKIGFDQLAAEEKQANDLFANGLLSADELKTKLASLNQRRNQLNSVLAGGSIQDAFRSMLIPEVVQSATPNPALPNFSGEQNDIPIDALIGTPGTFQQQQQFPQLIPELLPDALPPQQTTFPAGSEIPTLQLQAQEITGQGELPFAEPNPTSLSGLTGDQIRALTQGNKLKKDSLDLDNTKSQIVRRDQQNALDKLREGLVKAQTDKANASRDKIKKEVEREDQGAAPFAKINPTGKVVSSFTGDELLVPANNQLISTFGRFDQARASDKVQARSIIRESTNSINGIRPVSDSVGITLQLLDDLPTRYGRSVITSASSTIADLLGNRAAEEKVVKKRLIDAGISKSDAERLISLKDFSKATSSLFIKGFAKDAGNVATSERSVAEKAISFAPGMSLDQMTSNLRTTQVFLTGAMANRALEMQDIETANDAIRRGANSRQRLGIKEYRFKEPSGFTGGEVPKDSRPLGDNSVPTPNLDNVAKLGIQGLGAAFTGDFNAIPDGTNQLKNILNNPLLLPFTKRKF